MYITEIEAFVLDPDIDSASLPAATGALEVEVSSVLALVRTDEGITGVGESFHRSVAENEHLALAIETLGDHLIGRDPTTVTALWHELYDLHVKRSGMFEALSALDEALWDIVGKRAGRPVYELLGGAANEVRAYATFPHQKSPEELIDAAEWLDASGFESMKVGAGLGVEGDIARIETLAPALPEGFGLSIDANTTYDVTAALDVARVAAEHGLEWFEEPIPHTHTRGYVALRESNLVPIAAYQTYSTHYPAVELLRQDALDIYQPSLDHGGGVTAGHRVATMAEAFGKRLVPHAYGPVVNYAASLHVAVASPACTLIEYSVLSEEVDDPTRFIASPYVANQEAFGVRDDGTLMPPEAPGLGIDLDMNAVDEYRL